MAEEMPKLVNRWQKAQRDLSHPGGDLIPSAPARTFGRCAGPGAGPTMEACRRTQTRRPRRRSPARSAATDSRVDVRSASPTQRVGAAVVEVAIGVLGMGAIIGVFVRGLLPDISWSWLPDVPQWIQDLEAPAWLKYVDPFYWLGKLDIPWPGIDLPGWLTGSTKYWLPIVIALVIALGEIERRRKKADEAAADHE